MIKINAFEPIELFLFFLVVFAVIFLRYLVIAGVYHYLFFSLFRNEVDHKILDKKPLSQQQIQKEVYWSTLSTFIFTFIGIGLYALWYCGYPAIYLELASYPIWYFFVSIFFALFIQDTFYYWLHRWMHMPNVYRYIHKVHHLSVHTSVFTSFSFHPIETILQALILPFIIIVLPLHIYAVICILAFMTLSAVINHAGVEIFPANNLGKWMAKWIIGAAHHDYHHRKFTANFGLYFTFWDRWMDTEIPVSLNERTGKR